MERDEAHQKSVQPGRILAQSIPASTTRRDWCQLPEPEITMRYRRPCVLPFALGCILTLAPPIVLPAQDASQRTSQNAIAGLAVLQELARPLPATGLDGRRAGPAELAVLYLARAEQARGQSAGTNDLPVAAEARRVEALNLVWAALHGDVTQRERMRALVATVRQDSFLSEVRRF